MSSPAMAARNTLRRSLLYVPGSSQRFLDKSRSLAADCLTYDLEDSVTPHMKAEARSLVRRAIDQPTPSNIRERAVRINSVDSGLALGDLTEVVSTKGEPVQQPPIAFPSNANEIPYQLQSPNLTTIVIPKVNSASDLTFVTDVISHTLSQQKHISPENRAPISLIALIESAKSITNLSQICSSTPLLQGLIFAAEDFALDLSITRTPSLTEFLFARSAIVTAARAAELPSTIDLVCTAYKSDKADGSPPATLEEECRDGRRLGFNGKQCIHPTQVKTANAIFGPDEEETKWAVRVVIADEKAAAAGRGAWTLDGKMIDVPVAQKAKAIVKKAGACGVNVEALRKQWQHQEPE
ncbi:hypothetical protein N7466_004391 [Penicillium verhagenii]|uniref:uncharacterized protein n=1 Tax=Penicillium verhagenii TaxID=1562060 RepID=UPI0025455BE4|nr:uncharacterized protein N7466_004391 [Penicillium verhagenii]KAJ5934844.1 hypothetical protein N7466_004391 [Penicillium verhagenii]